MKPCQNDLINLEITDLGVSGEGVGSFNGFTLFVEGALPTEEIQAKVELVKSSYAKGSLLKVLKPSLERETPICPIFNECGGCQIMHLSYEGQLKVKKKRVEDAFLRIAKLPLDKPLKIHPSSPHLHYRNKIQLPAKNLETGVSLGLYKKGSHEIIEVNQCFIHLEVGEKVYSQILELLKASSLKAYEEENLIGELRHVLIRSSIFLNEVLVVFVTTAKASKEIKRIAREVIKIPEVKGVIHHKNKRSDNVVLDREFTLLEGESKILEKVNDLYFELSAASFFQVNPNQAENLYRYAISIAKITNEMKVLDAYCGIGTITLQLAKHAKQVIGVECVPQAIEDAKKNAERNNIKNVEFFCAVTEKFISSVKEVDVVFLNPPRKGCDIRVLKEIQRLSPQTIIYISCDPATLARDAKILHELGFVKTEVEAFDMFPQTMHVETVAKFQNTLI